MSASATRRPRVALAAVAAGLLLAACSSTQQPGAAVVIGGEAIPESTVATLADEVRAAAGREAVTGADLNRQVISTLVQQRVVGAAAQREGVTVTQTQVDQLIQQAAAESGQEQLEASLAGQYGVAPSQIPAFARTNLEYQGLASKLGNGDPAAGGEAASALISATAAELGVTVNPRFGAWTTGQLTVAPPPDDLSEPVAEAR